MDMSLAVVARPPFAPTFRSQYEHDGFAFVPDFVEPELIVRLRTAVGEILALGADLTADTIVRGVKFQIQSASGRSGDPALAPGVFRKVMFPHKASPEFRSFLKSDRRMQRAIAALGISNPRCVLDQINFKSPKVGTGFPWHQDARFLPPQRQAIIAAHGGANLVIALDDANEENGAFEVVAGSHRRGPIDFSYDTGDQNEEAFDLRGRQLIPMRSGDAVFFHPYLLHGSGPNRSAMPRCMITYWFINNLR
jgi:hypothetical protein